MLPVLINQNSGIRISAVMEKSKFGRNPFDAPRIDIHKIPIAAHTLDMNNPPNL